MPQPLSVTGSSSLINSRFEHPTKPFAFLKRISSDRSSAPADPNVGKAHISAGYEPDIGKLRHKIVVLTFSS
jgi:hypothetical protein